LRKNAAVHHSKNCAMMSQMGQTRSFADVGSMSGLPESGRRSALLRCRKSANSGHCRHSPNERYGMWAEARRYSALMLAALMIGHHLSISALWWA
jgi:hypothetical protein